MSTSAVTFDAIGMDPATQMTYGFKPLPSLARLDQLFEVRDGSLYNRVDRPRANKGIEAGAINTGTGYRFVCVDYVKYKVHRIIWAMVHRCDPGQMVVDHIDGNKLNNDPSNLRLLTKSHNALNAKRFGHNTSGCTGVSWYARDRRWVAKGKRDGKLFSLGRFLTKDEAVAARKAWEEQLWKQLP